MTKGAIIFGVAVGGTIGLMVPKLFGAGFGAANIITAIMGAVLGLFGVAIYVRWAERVR